MTTLFTLIGVFVVLYVVLYMLRDQPKIAPIYNAVQTALVSGVEKVKSWLAKKPPSA